MQIVVLLRKILITHYRLFCWHNSQSTVRDSCSEFWWNRLRLRLLTFPHKIHHLSNEVSNLPWYSLLKPVCIRHKIALPTSDPDLQVYSA